MSLQHSAFRTGKRILFWSQSTRGNIVWVFITTFIMCLLLNACVSQQTPPPELTSKQKQDTWLAQNYASATQGKKSTLLQMPTGSRFRIQILQGQITNGMRLEDALASLRMKPYGRQAQQVVFWCDNARVTRCSANCVSCQAMLFGQHTIVMLQGSNTTLSVNDFYPKRFGDYRASVDASALHFADYLYQHKIVPGMSAGLVQLIINQRHSKAQYYCGTSPQPDTHSCLGRCRLCKVVVTGRSRSAGTQSIFLETHAGRQSVANVIAQ